VKKEGKVKKRERERERERDRERVKRKGESWEVESIEREGKGREERGEEDVSWLEGIEGEDEKLRMKRGTDVKEEEREEKTARVETSKEKRRAKGGIWDHPDQSQLMRTTIEATLSASRDGAHVHSSLHILGRLSHLVRFLSLSFFAFTFTFLQLGFSFVILPPLIAPEEKHP
jgi:hypothetical protein